MLTLKAALQQQIDRLASTSLVGAERVDATEHCLAGVARLSNEVNEATPSLPAHNQRTYSESVKSLKTRLNDVRAMSQPKPKFSFKSRPKNNSATSLTDAAELAKKSRLQLSGDRPGNDLSSTTQSSRSETPAANGDDTGEANEEEQYPALRDMQEAASIRKPSFSKAQSVTISNHSNLHIILPSSAAHATTSGTLSKLKRCVVDMSVPTAHGQPFAGLSVKNITQSLVVCGRVSGPIHITGMEAVVLVVSCRQFRMHDCKNCDVYLFSTSKPIIEHCSGIRFAPIPPCHVRLPNRREKVVS